MSFFSKRIFYVNLLVLGLAACGGGNGSSTPPPPAPSAAWKALGGGIVPGNAAILALTLGGGQFAVYAGNGDPFNSGGGNVFLSTDNTPWRKIGNEGIPDNGAAMTLVAGKNGYVYVGSNGGGVYRATNINSTWQVLGVSAIPDKGDAVSVALSDTESNIYAGSSKGEVFVTSTTPGGHAWLTVGGGSMPDSGRVTVIATDTTTKTLYAATDGGDVYYVATNTPTENWRQVSSILPDKAGITALVANKGTIYVASNVGDVYAANISTSSTSAWSTVGQTNLPDGRAVASLAIDNNILYAGSRGGFAVAGSVYYTDTLTNQGWALLNNSSIASGGVYALAAAANIVYAGSSDGYVYISKGAAI